MQLLKYFKELTLHPKNAAELKGLILQLAVQGKLTANWRKDNPDVEPASVLLEKIKAEKEQLIKEKKIKKEIILDEITPEKYIKDIPNTWESVRMGEVIEIVRGITFPSSEKSKDDSPGKVPCLRTANVQDKIEWDDLLYIDRKFVKREDQILRNGDVIMSMANSYELVGKVALIDKELHRECTLGGFISALRTFQFNHYYLMILLRSPKTRGELISSSSQTTNIANVSIGKLRPLIIPFPPLAEQKAIVSVVNQLFAEVEQLETLTKVRIQLKADFATSALQQLSNAKSEAINGEWAYLQEHFSTFFTEKPNIKKLRESILQLAVQGKLTRHWRSEHPDTEDASVLLKKIIAEKEQLVKEKKIKDEKMISAITKDEIPNKIPKTWIWCRMQDLCPNISSGSTPPKPFFTEEGIPYLKVYNIRNQKIDFQYKQQFVDSEYHSTKLKRSILKPGDVIMNIVGPPLGKVAIIPDDFPEWNCNQAISFFQPLDRTLNTWIYTFLLAGTFLNYIELIGTAGQDNISVTKSKTIPIPLPPLEEQKAIVSKVNSLMALCDQLEQEIEQGQSQVEDLMQSCLREVVA